MASTSAPNDAPSPREIRTEGTHLGSAFPTDTDDTPRATDARQVYEHGDAFYVLARDRHDPKGRIETVYDTVDAVMDHGHGLNRHPTKHHCIAAENIEWHDDEATFGDGVTVPGECADCGEDQLSFYYDRVGVFDEDSKEYLSRF